MLAEDVLERYTVLRDHGIQIWIDGGWGSDALLEQQTRPHSVLICRPHTIARGMSPPPPATLPRGA